MRVPAMRTLENSLRRVGFAYVAGVDEVGRGCLAGPVVAAAVGTASRQAHSRGLRFETGAGTGARTAPREDRAPLGRMGRCVGRAHRNRSNQHPSGVSSRHETGDSLSGSASGRGAGRRVSGARSPDGAAGSTAWRSAMFGDCGRFDRGQSHARPTHAGTARSRPSIRLRSSQRLCDGGASRCGRTVRLLRCASPIVSASDAV